MERLFRSVSCTSSPKDSKCGIATCGLACLIHLQVNYPVEAKKNLANFSVVLDTPEYKRVTELKTHMSNVSCCY